MCERSSMGSIYLCGPYGCKDPVYLIGPHSAGLKINTFPIFRDIKKSPRRRKILQVLVHMDK